MYIFPLGGWRGAQRWRGLVNQEELGSIFSTHMVLTTIYSSSNKQSDILCVWTDRHEGKTCIHIKKFQFLDRKGIFTRTSKMAHWVTACAIKSDNLILIFSSHVVKGENWLLKVVLTPHTHTHTIVYTHTQCNKKFFFNLYKLLIF